MAGPGRRREATEPNKTNIVTSNSWCQIYHTDAIETARERGHDAALPELKKDNTRKATDDLTSSVPTRSIPQATEGGAPSRANNDKKREATVALHTKGTKRYNQPTACFVFELDMEVIQLQVSLWPFN